jgi:release factor glutamine methyltransferase
MNEPKNAAMTIEPRKEAGSLLSYAMAKDRTFLLTHPEATLDEETMTRFRSYVKRRAAGEPYQYITGQQAFYGLDFEVSPEVLIPRPETELLVEKALNLLEEVKTPFICDIGTGSGCIIISMLHERRDAYGIGVDISLNALYVAKRNMEKHKVGSRLNFVVSDCFNAINTRFDLIVSNPPYITERDVTSLQREVRDYEPYIALTPGGDGLKMIRKLLTESPKYLVRNGQLLIEIGFDQHRAVRDLIDERVWVLSDICPDLQGIPRVVILRLKD